MWRTGAPAEHLVDDANVLGTWIVTQAQWRALWDDCALVDQPHEFHGLSMREEVRTRTARIGWRRLLPAWGRALRIALT